MEFMHLGHEQKSLMWTILIPTAFVVWLLGALFIQLYRDEPILQLPHQLLTQLIDIDSLLTSWRYRHTLLVFRMIGVKIGTGGSAGHGYLKKTAEKHTIFRDIANLSTYIIPRTSLPKLPKELKKELGFYYTYEK